MKGFFLFFLFFITLCSGSYVIYVTRYAGQNCIPINQNGYLVFGITFSNYGACVTSTTYGNAYVFKANTNIYFYQTASCFGFANFSIPGDGSCVNDPVTNNGYYSYSMTSIPGSYIEFDQYDSTCQTPIDPNLKTYFPVGGCVTNSASSSYSLNSNSTNIIYNTFASSNCSGTAYPYVFPFGCSYYLGLTYNAKPVTLGVSTTGTLSIATSFSPFILLLIASIFLSSFLL